MFQGDLLVKGELQRIRFIQLSFSPIVYTCQKLHFFNVSFDKLRPLETFRIFELKFRILK